MKPFRVLRVSLWAPLVAALAFACNEKSTCSLEDEASSRATKAATFCGRVLVDGPRAEVDGCVARELAAKRPFWARYDTQNKDADIPEVATAVVREPSGLVSLLDFTSSPCGSPVCGGRVVQVLCADPTSAPNMRNKPPIACGQTADPKALCD